MELNNENYYSQEANEHYVSASQYKDFMGSLGKCGCEERALATIKGIWKPKTTDAMLIGSYVDSAIEGTLDKFKEDHSEIFSTRGATKGELKSNYKKADELIQFMNMDKKFMEYLSGEKQVIMTGSIAGVPVKIKMDSYIKDLAIVDLKVMANLKKSNYTRDYGVMPFTTYWGYDIQLAIYREIVRQNIGKELRCIIAGIDKQDYPDHELIEFSNDELNKAIIEVEQNIQHIQRLKNNEIEPTRCGKCDYCKAIKRVTGPIWNSELLDE